MPNLERSEESSPVAADVTADTARQVSRSLRGLRLRRNGLLQNLRPQRLQTYVRLLERDVSGEACEHVCRERESAQRGGQKRLRVERDHEPGRESDLKPVEFRFGDTHDRERLAFDRDDPPDRVGGAAELLPPHAVRQHRHVWRTAHIVGGVEQPADGCPNTERVEAAAR